MGSAKQDAGNTHAVDVFSHPRSEVRAPELGIARLARSSKRRSSQAGVYRGPFSAYQAEPSDVHGAQLEGMNKGARQMPCPPQSNEKLYSVDCGVEKHLLKTGFFT